MCDDGSTCIPIAFLCDGDNDCGGWEDETAECADGKSLLVATGSENSVEGGRKHEGGHLFLGSFLKELDMILMSLRIR